MPIHIVLCSIQECAEAQTITTNFPWVRLTIIGNSAATTRPLAVHITLCLHTGVVTQLCCAGTD